MSDGQIVPFPSYPGELPRLQDVCRVLAGKYDINKDACSLADGGEVWVDQQSGQVGVRSALNALPHVYVFGRLASGPFGEDATEDVQDIRPGARSVVLQFDQATVAVTSRPR